MFDKVVKNTVTHQVIEQIQTLLSGGTLNPGDKLPSERQMAEQLGVSRPSLREALRALEYAGVLVALQGEGVSVADGQTTLDNTLQTTHLVRQFALSEMIEARKAIESAAVKFIMIRAHAKDFEHIRQLHEATRQMVDDKKGFVMADYAFHRAIVDASGNRIFSSMHSTMGSMMKEFNFELLDTRVGREQVIDHHEQIVQALEKRDVDKSLYLMEEHLVRVVESMKQKHLVEITS